MGGLPKAELKFIKAMREKTKKHQKKKINSREKLMIKIQRLALTCPAFPILILLSINEQKKTSQDKYYLNISEHNKSNECSSHVGKMFWDGGQRVTLTSGCFRQGT